MGVYLWPSYSVCNGHDPYYIVILWPVRLYNIFPNYLINGTIFEKVIKQKMQAFIFSTPFVWNIPHSTKKWARYDQKCILVFMWSAFNSWQILMKLGFSLQIFENTQTSNLMKIRSVGAKLFHADGQTDGREGSNSRISKFCQCS